MLQKTDSDAPAYRRIQHALRQRIEAGELQPGDAVPSERELARSHEVSLMTARHALAELEHEGLVDRRRGAGTFVSLPRIHFNRLASFTEQMASRGLPARSRILYAGIVESEQEAAAKLALPAHSKLVKLERLRQSGEQPFAVENCYFPADEFAGLLDLPLERRSLFATLDASTVSSCNTPMKRWMPPQPARASRSCLAFTRARRCCASARSCFPPPARRPCM